VACRTTTEATITSERPEQSGLLPVCEPPAKFCNNMNNSPTSPYAGNNHYWILGSNILSIGAKYPMPPQQMREGGNFARFNCTGADQDLNIFAPNIDSPEVLRFQTERFEFGLQVYRDVIFLAYRCGPFHGDAPCSWHLNPEDDRTLPSPMSSADARLGLMVVLVDGSNGIIKGMRLTPLSAKFSQALNSAVTDQSQRPWTGMDAYKMQVQAAYGHWKTPQKMMRNAVVHSNEVA